MGQSSLILLRLWFPLWTDRRFDSGSVPTLTGCNQRWSQVRRWLPSLPPLFLTSHSKCSYFNWIAHTHTQICNQTSHSAVHGEFSESPRKSFRLVERANVQSSCSVCFHGEEDDISAWRLLTSCLERGVQVKLVSVSHWVSVRDLDTFKHCLLNILKRRLIRERPLLRAQVCKTLEDAKSKGKISDFLFEQTCLYQLLPRNFKCW